ncbi:unnamed protein product [Paramecium sonneborni]|uniref:Uncharacterized protein n=1 Tax=Paramecium sonneborni TaxID=65129 RepID=A0A8S1KHU3_9CILI|nr:unnamed protein product [Paramecium sonneborni]
MDFDRKHILLNVFSNLNIDFDQPISENVIYKFLDEKSHGTFDNSITLQLYQQVIQNYQKLTINNFINIYQQTETILEIKVEQKFKTQQSQINTLQEHFLILQNRNNQEQLNKYRIMKIVFYSNSCSCQQTQSINEIQQQVFKLILKMNQTGMVPMNFNILQFISPIENGSEIINEFVKAYQGNKIIDIGQATYAVQQFNSQAYINVEVKLQCIEPYSRILILLGLWIFSKTKYFSELISQLEKQISQLKDDLTDYENPQSNISKQFNFKLSCQLQYLLIKSREKQIDNIVNTEDKTLNKYLVAIMALLITISSLNKCYIRCQVDEINLNYNIYILCYTPDIGIQKIMTEILLFITKLHFSFHFAYLLKQAFEIIPEFQVKKDENELSGFQLQEQQNISRNESLFFYQQQK